MRALEPLTRILRPRRPPIPNTIPPRRPPQTASSSSRPSSTNTKPTTNPTTNNTASETTTTHQQQKRLDRILARLPRPLRAYTFRLRGAPLTHVAAFLVLHEITAIVPLLGLFGLFHYTEYVPLAWMVGHYGGYVKEGVGRFERWFERRGWFGFGGEEQKNDEGGGEKERGKKVDDALRRWEEEPKYRVVVEVGLAYALTKVLLPVRIVGSLWATPWFAGVLGRLGRVVRRGG